MVPILLKSQPNCSTVVQHLREEGIIREIIIETISRHPTKKNEVTIATLAKKYKLVQKERVGEIRKYSMPVTLLEKIHTIQYSMSRRTLYLKTLSVIALPWLNTQRSYLVKKPENRLATLYIHSQKKRENKERLSQKSNCVAASFDAVTLRDNKNKRSVDRQSLRSESSTNNFRYKE
ncbi:hypothetical protein H6P81_020095 [Aristolochia fimbriata]|uniref:Uncharacterized protein n=1 Tax=Aristolochia fimbriata TaxID=158543 RepID=A0AAV7DVD0_ARIFI|nr:hypothetical protein H6P81_020095 [Aristolochia fimbriata]